MDNSLKNRYIYAVTRHLPFKMQADVEQELDSLITEMSAQRDIKDVLAELGSPEELALKYCGSERKALISGTYFLMYKYVLRVVLPIVAAVLAVLTTIGHFVGGEGSLNIIIGFVDVSSFARVTQVFGVALGGVVMAFAIITIVFAVLDYLKVDLKDGNILDLPDVPDARHKISIAEPIWGIAIAIASTVLFFGFPQIMRARFDYEWVNVFNVNVIRSLWLPILAWTVIEIVAELVKLVEGRYTKRLAVVTVVTAALQVVCAVFVFVGNDIVNPEFITQATSYVADLQALGWIINNIVVQPNLMILAIILIVLAFETLEIVVKSFQSKH